eukprot:355246-Chlamydomonas_euryale.AAC.3
MLGSGDTAQDAWHGMHDRDTWRRTHGSKHMPRVHSRLSTHGLARMPQHACLGTHVPPSASTAIA